VTAPSSSQGAVDQLALVETSGRSRHRQLPPLGRPRDDRFSRRGTAGRATAKATGQPRRAWRWRGRVCPGRSREIPGARMTPTWLDLHEGGHETAAPRRPSGGSRRGAPVAIRADRLLEGERHRLAPDARIWRRPGQGQLEHLGPASVILRVRPGVRAIGSVAVHSPTPVSSYNAKVVAQGYDRRPMRT
jgi:hypothetical protein